MARRRDKNREFLSRPGHKEIFFRPIDNFELPTWSPGLARDIPLPSRLNYFSKESIDFYSIGGSPSGGIVRFNQWIGHARLLLMNKQMERR